MLFNIGILRIIFICVFAWFRHQVILGMIFTWTYTVEFDFLLVLLWISRIFDLLSINYHDLFVCCVHCYNTCCVVVFLPYLFIDCAGKCLLWLLWYQHIMFIVNICICMSILLSLYVLDGMDWQRKMIRIFG